MSRPVVYLLWCGDGSLYCGSTTDLERRLAEHAAGSSRSAKYTRSRGPLALAACWSMPDLTAARRAEALVKRLPRAQKLALVEGRRALPG